MAKIEYVWEYDFYGKWFDAVYESGSMRTATENSLPKTVKKFLLSAKNAEIHFKKFGYKNHTRYENGEEVKIIHYNNFDELPDWIKTKINS